MNTPWHARVHAGRRWLIDRAPLPLLTKAHEIALSIALVIIGVALVLEEAQPGSVTSQVPHWVALIWAWAILLGGVATLWGIFGSRTRIEWFGQTATGHGCAFYSLAVATALPLRTGFVVVMIFAVLALVSWWRAFKLTMMPYVQERLARETTKAALRLRREQG